MPNTSAALATKLQTEGEKVHAFFAVLTPEQWEVPVYTEGEKWTPRSILAHLVTAERGFLKLFEAIRQGGTGVSEDFSIDRYNASQQEKTKGLSPADLLPQYAAVRAEMTAYVSTLSDDDLATRGRHPAMGMSTLAEMVKMLYLHNNMHLRDIRLALASP
jgi:hypothetical protein